MRVLLPASARAGTAHVDGGGTTAGSTPDGNGTQVRRRPATGGVHESGA